MSLAAAQPPTSVGVGRGKLQFTRSTGGSIHSSISPPQTNSAWDTIRRPAYVQAVLCSLHASFICVTRYAHRGYKSSF